MAGLLSIRQPERGYRFSIDSVLLAGFAAPWCRGAVLDLGTGCGVLLLLLSRLSEAMVCGIGVELQGELLSCARENFRDNAPEGLLRAVEGDFRGELPEVVPGSFDLVVSNPPYGRVGEGRRSPEPGKEAARHEVACSLPDIFAAAARYMAPHGRFASGCLRKPSGSSIRARGSRRRGSSAACRGRAAAPPASSPRCSCMVNGKNIARRWSGSAASSAPGGRFAGTGKFR